MGGSLILLTITLSVLMWADLRNRYVWLVLAVMLCFGAIGWYDDWIKIVRRDPNGLKSRWKYLLQSIFGLAAGLFLFYTADVPAALTFYIPMFKSVALPLAGIGFVAIAYFWIVGFSNAVNLTDGLDGLAIMPTVLVACALGVFAYASGNVVFANYLQIPQIRAPANWSSSVRPSPEPAWASCGSTPIRPWCSWATSARWRWVRCWAPSR